MDQYLSRRPTSLAAAAGVHKHCNHMTKRPRSSAVPSQSCTVMPSQKSSSSSSSRSKKSSSWSKPGFAPPAMGAPGSPARQHSSSGSSSSSKCTQSLIRAGRSPGFPAAEQLDVFLHEAMRGPPKREDKKSSSHQSSAGPARRRCRPPARRMPRQADCFVELCPEGSHEVVMHPGF